MSYNPNSTLPFLPGYQTNLEIRSNFPKCHHFQVLQQVPLDVSTVPKVDPRAVGTQPLQGGSTLSESQLKQFAHLRRAPVAKDYENSAAPTPFLPIFQQAVPAWIEFDRKVLRFSGYFKEAVHASATENYRIRVVQFLFYLSDLTLQIVEMKQENSGIVQQDFIKRHLVPKGDGKQYVGITDLEVGKEILIYGRVFRVIDADDFTRAFYTANSRPLAQAELQPLDPFLRKLAAFSNTSPTQHHKKTNAVKDYMEARAGKIAHGGIAQTQQFLKNDRKVLRFYCVWNDDKLYGEKRQFILHYFLADDTVEVLEVNIPNSGRSPFPQLLKRQKLPKQHNALHYDCSNVGADLDIAATYYKDNDFRVGQYINCYGRQLLLCGVDAFTKNYYMTTYNLSDADFPTLPEMRDVEEVPHRVEAPPSTGFGEEEDSLGSFLYLMPKAPKPDLQKLFECEGILLRFRARFINPAPEDLDRKFIVTYYVANDSLQIFETFERNAGHIGGKFLERSRVKNAATNEYYSAADLYPGAQIEIYGRKFIIEECDAYTEKFIESNPHIWRDQKQNDDGRSKDNTHLIYTSKANSVNTGVRRPY